ncbi:MAG: hypothetical protein H0X64_10000 [Gemmatimonadaceae bacterium]|nr:hypothetical protein [Gemmatimonadaceae bacterium]
MLAIVGLVGVGACDPCFGTVSCEVGPRVVVTGQLVEAMSGAPVDGVPIRAVVVRGVAEPGTEVVTTTSAGGHWRAEFTAFEAGEVFLDVTVSPPALSEPYVVRGVRVHTVDVRGDAHLLPRWVVNPWFNIHGELFLRGTDNDLIMNTAVAFTRTGGAAITGPAVSDGVFRAPTDPHGRVQLFQFAAFPDRLASVVGDLTLTLPAPYGPATVRGVELVPTHEYRPLGNVYRMAVGPNMDYYVSVADRVTGETVGGVGVEFRRTGGVVISPETITTSSDAFGWVRLQPRAFGNGDVIGDLTITPPAPYAGTVIRGYRLSTFEDGIGRSLGVWYLDRAVPSVAPDFNAASP